MKKIFYKVLESVPTTISLKPFSSRRIVAPIHTLLSSWSAPKAEQEDEITTYTIGKYTFNYPFASFNLYSREQVMKKSYLPIVSVTWMFCTTKQCLRTTLRYWQKYGRRQLLHCQKCMDVFITKLRKRDENIEIVTIHGNGFPALSTEPNKHNNTDLRYSRINCLLL